MLDAASVSGAYTALKSAKDILKGAFDAKVDAEVRPKVYEAMQQLGGALDTLYSLRSDLFELQEANNKLRLELATARGWADKSGEYELVTTPGTAIVYRFKGEPLHYACPSCFNKHEIHPLQPNRTYSGKYRCTGCTSEFPIDQQQKPPSSARPSGQGGGWMA